MSRLIIIIVVFTMCMIPFSIANESNLVNIEKLTKQLEEKERLLNEKEKKLEERERTIKILEEDLKVKRAELDKIRTSVEDTYNKNKVNEDKNLDHLVKVYTNTKPKAAAEIMSKMDVNKIVAIFQKMSPKDVGKIMTALSKISPETASKVTEILTPKK